MHLLSILLLVSLSVFAQSGTPLDFLSASKKVNFLNDNLIMEDVAGGCKKIESENSESVMSCAIKDDDYQEPIVKVDYADGEMPELIKSTLPHQFIQDTKGKKVSCLFRFKLLNDNWGSENRANGDDVGLSHKLDVGMSCTSVDGVSTAFTYSTALYSKVQESSRHKNSGGLWVAKAKLNSENIFEVLQDNINAGKVTYWKRGVGFINITDKKKWGLMQSSGQQEWFHHTRNLISKGSTIEYEYERGSADRYGAFITLAIGLQENRKLGDSCVLEFNADAGTRLSTLKGSSTLNLNLQSKLSYHVSENSSVYLRAQSEATRRSTSTIVENTVAVGYQGKAGYIEGGITQQNGVRKDVYDSRNIFTGKTDKLVFLRVGKNF